MNTKIILEYLLELSDYIKHIEAEIEKFYEISGITYNDMPKASKQKDLSDVIVAISNLKNDKQEKIDIYMKVRMILLNTLMEVKKSNYRQVIKLKYFDEKDWNEISEEMGYSVKHVQRICKSAISLLDLKLAPRYSEISQLIPASSFEI